MSKGTFGIIYKITNLVNDKVYVGQTIRKMDVRWKRHVHDSKTLNYPLYRAMRKYGVENFTIKQVMVAKNKKELNNREGFGIKLYKSTTKEKGYNITLGGTDRTFDKQALDRISEKNIIAWSNNEYKKMMVKKRIKGSLKRYSESFNVYKAVKVRIGGNKAYLYNKGEYIGTWNNHKPCCEELNLSPRTIGSCLNGKRKQHKGYIFERIKGDIENGTR